MSLENPFVVGRYVGGKYFCDRQDETSMLIKQIRNGRDIVLISPRRMGKSGLIHHLFDQKEIKERYNVFFIDIFSCSSLQEMIWLLGKAIFSQLKPKSQVWIERFFQIITSFRAGLKMDVHTGLPVFELGLGDISSPETTLEEIFRFLSSADRECVIAIDEFQQILRFKEKNVEALLRTYIQQCPNVHWIFAGSQRHMIQGMFLSPGRPFYQSALTTTLMPIPKKAYSEFAMGWFAEYGKSILPDVVSATYDRYQGYTWYIQMAMNEIFDICPPEQCARSADLEKAISNILQMQSDNYREQLSMLSVKQKALLQAFARENEVSEPTSAAFVAKYALGSSSSVQSAMKRLLELDIITASDSVYRITDFFFLEWLRINF